VSHLLVVWIKVAYWRNTQICVFTQATVDLPKIRHGLEIVLFTKIYSYKSYNTF